MDICINRMPDEFSSLYAKSTAFGLVPTWKRRTKKNFFLHVLDLECEGGEILHLNLPITCSRKRRKMGGDLYVSTNYG